MPGDGTVDYLSVFKELLKGYSGWVVLEAEQDPNKATPEKYVPMGCPQHEAVPQGSRAAIGAHDGKAQSQAEGPVRAASSMSRRNRRAGPMSASMCGSSRRCEIAKGDEASREICLVFVSGKGRVVARWQDLGEIGGRMSPFEGKPWSVYVPAGSRLVGHGHDAARACRLHGARHRQAPGARDRARKLGQEMRGKGTNVRHVTNILPEDEPAESLLVVEVITPAGHTSSYPPHKHDTRRSPAAESLLEETYYHRLKPAQGFAFQRVYTDDRSLDEAMAVEDGDVTLVPKGYHPCRRPRMAMIFIIST